MGSRRTQWMTVPIPALKVMMRLDDEAEIEAVEVLTDPPELRVLVSHPANPEVAPRCESPLSAVATITLRPDFAWER